MEAWLKEGGKGSWTLNQLWMPAGDSVPYNAMTVVAPSVCASAPPSFVAGPDDSPQGCFTTMLVPLLSPSGSWLAEPA